MRRVLVGLLALVLAGGQAAAQQLPPKTEPGRAPPRGAAAAPERGWDTDAGQFFVGIEEADRANGFRTEMQAAGCRGAQPLLCDLRLRGVAIRGRAPLPARRMTEVEISLPGDVPRAIAASVLHTMLRWAEPSAPRQARTDAVLMMVQTVTGRASTVVAGTSIRMDQGFSGFTVTLSPAPR